MNNKTPQNNTWQERLAEVHTDTDCCQWINVEEFIDSELQRALQECLPERNRQEIEIDAGLYTEVDICSCREQFIKNAKERGIELK